ncbi:MAG: D-alanyl-D-alanine carboxypeptidase [Oscillospiraceae bacterium]|nr:D-alanyl-D-alanine carboxypeptidase [Oscillospiraceae bacterium]
MHLKRRMCSVLMTLGLLAGLFTPTARAAQVEITAPSAILMDAATGEILYELDDHVRLVPASVTKIMTLLLVMEALDSRRITWDDTVTASAAAAGKGGSQVYLEEGEQMPLREMVKCVVVSSANDCATALAEHVYGSEAVFVEKMNERAAQLGMADTHFVNCTGLDDDPDAAEHLTSAYDIALMSRELLKHDEIRAYTTIWMDTVRGGAFGLSNTNKLVRFYDGTTGLKTGFTRAAGYCMSATAERGGLELIAVVLHCATSTDRFQSAKALLDYGFANYCHVSPVPDAALPDVHVRLGQQSAITPVLADETQILLDKSLQGSVRYDLQVQSAVTAPVEPGQRLGSVKVIAGDQVVSEVPVVAAEAVARLGWWALTKGYLRAALSA